MKDPPQAEGASNVQNANTALKTKNKQNNAPRGRIGWIFEIFNLIFGSER
jgi:hypothetical protein